ncbi:MAG: hypothetical protein IT361_02740 [Gemmatimonadaceae bacterium]|nr:hypothetical protein [Gemmatimonadaceae bacterium]
MNDLTTTLRRAIVIANGRPSEFLVSGAGRPLLFLAEPPLDEALVSEVGRVARVFAPVVPAEFLRSMLGPLDEGAAHHSWLDGVLDALGFIEGPVLATTPLLAAISTYAAVSPGRVGSVIAIEPCCIIDLDWLATRLGQH